MSPLSGRRVPRIAFRTLQDPISQHGLAFPNLYLYYLATLLIPKHDWLNEYPDNAPTITEAAITTSFEPLTNMVYRGENKTVKEVNLICSFALWIEYQNYGYLQIGRTPRKRLYGLTHICLPCATFWSKLRIKRICHLFKTGMFRLSVNPKEAYGVAHTRLYLYFQLRHAAASQFLKFDASCKRTSAGEVTN